MSRVTIDPARLQVAFDLANEYVQQGRLPSAVLAVANRHKLIRHEAFSAPGGDHVQLDSIYYLASLTKTFFAVALVQLVQDGRLILSEPVARYLPEFDAPETSTVTSWHLLTHTSGMPDLDWETLQQRWPTYKQILQETFRSQLHFTPGTQFEYGTRSFYLIAELINRLSGMHYVEYLKQRIFVPLGMIDTSFDPLHLGTRVVPPHMIHDTYAVDDELLQLTVDMAMPGGGLWSTAADLVAYGQALLNNGRAGDAQILAPAYIDLMTRDHTTGLWRHNNGQRYPVHYGLAWRKGSLDGYATLPGSGHVFEHDGASGVHLWVDPDWDLVYVFLTNRFQIDGPLFVTPLQVIYSALRLSA